MAETDAKHENLINALRILAEHIPMSTDARRRVAIFLGDPDPNAAAVPPVDPRDAVIAALQARLAVQSAPPSTASAAAPVIEPTTVESPAEAPSVEVAAEPVQEAAVPAPTTDDAAASTEEPAVGA